MSRTGRPKARLELSAEERSELESLARRRKTSRRESLRAMIVLECAKGKSNDEVATTLGVRPHTIGRWRSRFVAERMAGLVESPRSGRPRTIVDEDVERLVVATLETTPQGATHWSTREMAKKVGICPESVARIWRAFGLKPHRREGFQLSKDPAFIDKVRDVVGLYLDPPIGAVVLSVDEKSQIQALNRTQPLLPMSLAQLERGTPEYQRHGTTSLFAALDVATGYVIGKCYRRHRSAEFVKFLSLIETSIEPDLAIHLILDNYATHKSPKVKAWLLRNPRVHLHFIPTHSSWLNQVESWFSILTARQIKRASHTNVRALERSINEFLRAHNGQPKPFRWTKSADEIFASVARRCADTLRIHTK